MSRSFLLICMLLTGCVFQVVAIDAEEVQRQKQIKAAEWLATFKLEHPPGWYPATSEEVASGEYKTKRAVGSRGSFHYYKWVENPQPEKLKYLK